MKKYRVFMPFFFSITLLCFLSLGVVAQGRNGGRGGGYGNSGSRFSSPRNYVSITNNYRGYNSNRFNYGLSYNYYPSYQYRSIYQSPYVYAHFGPAFGFRINVLPFGYNPFYIGNNPFYYYQGIYYRPYIDGGYEVTAPPLGAIVKHLPDRVKVTIINGQKYFELGGTFYEGEISAKNKLQYRVIGINGVINTSDLVEDRNNDTSDVKVTGNDYAPSVNATNDIKINQDGQKIDQLPANSKVVIINKQKLYLTPNGIYYKEIIDADNKLTYECVGGK